MKQPLGNWVKDYNQLGLAGLDTRKGPGRPRKLSADELKEIKGRLQREMDFARSSKSAVIESMIQILNDEYEVQYSRGRMYDLINQLVSPS